MSVRDEIVALLDTRLKGIGIASGYQTDAGANVYAWEEYQFVEPVFPALTWRDENRSVDADSEEYDNVIGDEIHVLGVTIEGATRCSADIHELRALLADIRKAIAVDITWDDKAITTDKWSDELFADEEEDELLGFVNVTLNIVYGIDAWTD